MLSSNDLDLHGLHHMSHSLAFKHNLAPTRAAQSRLSSNRSALKPQL